MNKRQFLHEMKAIAKMEVSLAWLETFPDGREKSVELRKKLFDKVNKLLDESYKHIPDEES